MAEISHVVRPAWGWFAALDGGMAALAVLCTVAPAYDAVAEVSPAPFPSRQALRALLVGAVAIHLAEAVAAGRIARRRDLPPGGWAFQTLLVGFPSLLALRRARTLTESIG
jgi:hypothetical protein